MNYPTIVFTGIIKVIIQPIIYPIKSVETDIGIINLLFNVLKNKNYNVHVKDNILYIIHYTLLTHYRMNKAGY